MVFPDYAGFYDALGTWTTGYVWDNGTLIGLSGAGAHISLGAGSVTLSQQSRWAVETNLDFHVSLTTNEALSLYQQVSNWTITNASDDGHAESPGYRNNTADGVLSFSQGGTYFPYTGYALRVSSNGNYDLLRVRPEVYQLWSFGENTTNSSMWATVDSSSAQVAYTTNSLAFDPHLLIGGGRGQTIILAEAFVRAIPRGTPNGTMPTVTFLPPPAPTSFSVTGSTASSISLGWSNPGNATNDTLFWGPNCSTLRPFTSSLYTSGSLGVRSNLTLLDLPSGASYCFAIASWNLAGMSPWAYASGRTANLSASIGGGAPAFFGGSLFLVVLVLVVATVAAIVILPAVFKERRHSESKPTRIPAGRSR